MMRYTVNISPAPKSNEFFGTLNFCKLDSLFEEQKLETMMAKERKRERDERKEKLKNNYFYIVKLT